MPAEDALRGLGPWLAGMSGKKLVVWGDVVADRFLHGTTTRVSREAPALVLRYDREDVRPGGAGNAALNAAALGARVSVVSSIGDDVAGRQLQDSFTRAGIDISGLRLRSDGRTPVKTRVMAGGVHTVRQQILRIDDEPRWPALATEQEDDALDAALLGADALLISDYGLGNVSAATWQRLRGRWRELPVTLDSRFALLSFPGVTAATPNQEEVEGALRVRLNGDEAALRQAGRDLLEQLRCDGVLITRGSLGIEVFHRGGEPVHLPIYGTDEIADVTGAGDTVIATFTLALAAGASLLDAARLANVAAGLVVLKHGTATVSTAELATALQAEA